MSHKSSKSKLLALGATPFLLSVAQVSLQAAPATSATLTEPEDFRIVAGTTPGLLDYTITDTGAADQDLDFSILQYTLGANAAKEYGSLVSLVQGDPAVDTALGGVYSYSGYSLSSGGTAKLSVQPDITGLSAGDSVDLGVRMNGSGWAAPVTSTTSINVVQNRLLTGSLTLNSGRHMLGVIPDGTLTLDGGTLSGTEGTNISINSGGFAQYGNGVRLTSASDFTFDGATANQTHDLQVGYYGPAGAYSQSITLSGANGADNYTTASGATRNEFGGYWRTEIEVGSVLGATETRVTGKSYTPFQATGVNGIYTYPDGSTPTIERNSNRVETPQPTPATQYDQGTFDAARAGGVQVNERVNSLISGEVIQGSSLNLSGVNLSVSGTALYNRQLTASASTGNIQTNLGRAMVSATTETINQSGTLTYTSSGSDDAYTRIQLSDFSDSSDGITASYSGGDQSFTGAAGQEAEVAFAANFTVDRSVNGTFGKSLVAGAGKISSLENGGAGLANESVQSGLSLGYQWSNVLDNQIDIKDQHVYLFDDTNLSGMNISAEEAYNHGYSGLNNGQTHRVNSTNTHTAIGVNDSISLSGTRTLGDKLEGTITVNSANGRVTAENLIGESVIASDTFQVYTHTIGRADLDITAPVDNKMDHNDVVTLENADRGLTAGDQASVDVQVKSYDGSARWTIDYAGNTLLAPGQSATMTAKFDDVAAGELGGSFTSVFTYTTQDSFDVGSHFSNLGLADDKIADNGDLWNLANATLATHQLTLARVVEQVSSTGSGSFEAGAKLSDTAPSLTNTGDNSSAAFSTATSASLLDSGLLGSATTVSMTYHKIEDASVTDIYGEKGAVTDFATDVLDLTGLDGEKHVLELTYDDTVLAEGEGAMQIVWLTQYDADPGAGESLQDIWVNAVLGNKNVVLDILGGTVTVSGEGTMGIQTYLQSKRFSGSYESYLTSIGGEGSDPELGMWGLDAGTNNVWAVIDHNSSFAGAVPEPSSLALFALGGLCAIMRRRR